MPYTKFLPLTVPRVLARSLFVTALCAATAACLPAQSQQPTGDESWSSTKENSSQNVNPSRTTESHTKSGNRTVDKQRVEVLGPNGGYQPFTETETETVQVNDSTTKTIVRTYQWNGSGQRYLAQVTEENSRATSGGSAHVERKTSSADVNGNLQITRREVSDTKKIGPNAEETKTTVFRPDSYGGLSQAEQTQEVKTQATDNSLSIKKTTQRPDGNGSWKVSGVTETTVKDDGKNRTSDERVSSPDLDGRLHESTRTISKENETPSGDKKSIVETYDGGTQLNKRVTTTKKRSSTGEVTEEQVEQPNLGNPSDGARVTGRAKYVVKYATPGMPQSQQSKTVENRDANGNFHVVDIEKQKSTQPPPQTAPPPSTKDNPPPQPAPKPQSGDPDKP